MNSCQFSIINFAKDYHLYGNATIEDAEVIVVTHIPTNLNICKKNVDLINSLWDENHLILVEITACGVEINSDYNEIARGINKRAIILGCDIDNLELNLQTSQEKERAIILTAKQIKKSIYARDYINIKKGKEQFEELTKNDSINKEAMLYLKNYSGSCPFEYYSPLMLCIIDKVLYVTRQQIRKEMEDYYKESFPIRQTCFINAMEKGLEEAEKVIICLTASHVIRNPELKGNEYDIQKMENFLNSKKFVIFCAKTSPLQVSRNMPELWGKTKERERCLDDEEIDGSEIVLVLNLDEREHNFY